MTDLTVPTIEITLIVAIAAFLLYLTTYHGPWLVRTVKTWLFTTDHRRIGIMYLSLIHISEPTRP